MFQPRTRGNTVEMSKVSLVDMLELSVAERIQMVEDIWDLDAAAAPIN